MRTRQLAPAAAALAVALTVGGCATPPGGIALKVDGRTVSNRQVDRSTTDCLRVNPQSARADVRGAVATMYLQGLIGDRVARAEHIVVNQDAREAAVRQLATTGQDVSRLRDGGQCQRAVDSWLSLIVVESRLGAAKLLATAHRLDPRVQVNPQYGGYDATRLTLTGASGSLSQVGVPSITIGG